MSNSARYVAAFAALIATGAGAEDTAEKVLRAIRARDPSLQVVSVQKSAASSLYLVQMDGGSAYVTADGQYLVVGDMFELSSGVNLTEQGRQAERRGLLRSVDPASAIVFAPDRPKYSIVVFTDSDCPYCRQLHSDIAQLNNLGIAVRYLAFPRSGPGTESWLNMEAVWCADNRRDALTRATHGEKIPRKKDCTGREVTDHHAIGRKLGVPGTPMILLDDGTTLGGYLPPAKLLQELQSHGATPR